MVNLSKFEDVFDDEFLNRLNTMVEMLNVQGKSVQDLVAEGQLTPTQYAQLIKAVNGLISKGDVSVLDINKNLGKFDATYFTNEFLDDLNNGTVDATKLLPSSVLREHVDNNAITGAKTTFLQPASKNLFNKNAVVYGQRFDENGDIFTSTDWSYSERMQVKRNQDYIITGLHGANPRLNYYDGNNNLVKTETLVPTPDVPIKITTTGNTYFIVLSARSSQVPDIQITEGNVALPYSEYYDELQNVKLTDYNFNPNTLSSVMLKQKSIDTTKVDFIEESSNLFNKDDLIDGMIDDDGVEVEHIYNAYTEKLTSVEPSGKYYMRGVISISIHDITGKFLRREDVPLADRDGFIKTMPNDVAQVRFIMRKATHSPSEVQVNKGDKALPYEPYYKKLSDKIRVEGATGTGEKTVYINVPNEGISYFGIDGNGVSDDTQGLKDYLYSLKENGGGEMSLPNGTYKINGTLEVPSNVIISGQGNSTLFKLGDNHDLTGRLFRGERISRPYIVTEENSENVYFRDFKVLGNTNIFEDALHHAVAFMDTVGGGITNVSTGYINYDPSTAIHADLMAFNIAFIRAKEVRMTGGKHEYGGYENIGFEFAEDIIVDGIFSGDAWRTSYQLHQGNKNIKTINSTIRQTLSTADAAMTLHARGGAGESDDLLFQNNTVLLQAPGGSHQYMGTVQMFGPHKKASFLGNTIKGQKNGIYNLNTAELMIANDNIIEAETGIALRFDGTGIANGNFVKTKSGMTPFEKAEGSNVVGSGNIGFDIV